MNSASDVWNKVLKILGSELTTTAITTWFDDCKAVEITDNRLVIYTPSNFKKDVIEGRFLGSLKNALREIFSGDFDVLVLGEGEFDSFKPKGASGHDPAEEEYTFERFVVGNSNKFAHAAAKAVAEGQIKNFNPLFIYGDSGLGKTHLLHAIRHAVSEKHPEYNIVYVKGDDFTNELIHAIQVGKNVEFREKYRVADLFLMDDIQFIAGKIQTQEEFFHTFNTLYEANRQIVFTSDRPPNEMMRLEDRLKTRFESGLLADIQPPDYETRMAIIKNKAQQLGLFLPDDVSNYIAENMTSNVRQIEGAVKKVMAYRDLMNDSITVSSVSKAIKDMFKEKTEFTPTSDLIIDETAKYYSLTSDDLKGQRRTRNTALARQISMYLIRKLTNLSLKDIGDLYEGRDHTTVLSSIRRIESELKSSAPFNQTIKDITANINSRS
ncbi:chromosomal replication initiator protein [Sporobacter termitidis DSM 10068]|uniref:Chromosomal replication initiator protein DnaA n=1 Tax=Sporobacter termitidis DSM 10068 TaxID=1123282 RepID=A0A1M5VUD2_9FIRM|nr:chromosomal replication initiator protein DnaA [Sporobacter termitidis]SHH78882.1 chromosomal replication initiator protein [Sporobacter termitidis DSM 10068]